MSFFLVTHTSLVEADDEIAAAEKTLANLQSESATTFTVKFDEESVKQIVIRGGKGDQSSASPPPQPVDQVNAVAEKSPASNSFTPLGLAEGSQNKHGLNPRFTRLLVFAAGLSLGFAVCTFAHH